MAKLAAGQPTFVYCLKACVLVTFIAIFLTNSPTFAIIDTTTVPANAPVPMNNAPQSKESSTAAASGKSFASKSQNEAPSFEYILNVNEHIQYLYKTNNLLVAQKSGPPLRIFNGNIFTDEGLRVLTDDTTYRFDSQGKLISIPDYVDERKDKTKPAPKPTYNLKVQNFEYRKYQGQQIMRIGEKCYSIILGVRAVLEHSVTLCNAISSEEFLGDRSHGHPACSNSFEMLSIATGTLGLAKVGDDPASQPVCTYTLHNQMGVVFAFQNGIYFMPLGGGELEETSGWLRIHDGAHDFGADTPPEFKQIAESSIESGGVSNKKANFEYWQTSDGKYRLLRVVNTIIVSPTTVDPSKFFVFDYQVLLPIVLKRTNDAKLQTTVKEYFNYYFQRDQNAEKVNDVTASFLQKLLVEHTKRENEALAVGTHVLKKVVGTVKNGIGSCVEFGGTTMTIGKDCSIRSNIRHNNKNPNNNLPKLLTRDEKAPLYRFGQLYSILTISDSTCYANAIVSGRNVNLSTVSANSQDCEISMKVNSFTGGKFFMDEKDINDIFERDCVDQKFSCNSTIPKPFHFSFADRNSLCIRGGDQKKYALCAQYQNIEVALPLNKVATGDPSIPNELIPNLYILKIPLEPEQEGTDYLNSVENFGTKACTHCVASIIDNEVSVYEPKINLKR